MSNSKGSKTGTICKRDFKATLRDAREVANSIIRAMNPAAIVLFGSVAREGSGEDLDLLIVTDDAPRRPVDPGVALHKCLKRFYRKFSIDPFIVPVSLLNEYHSKGSPFLRL